MTTTAPVPTHVVNTVPQLPTSGETLPSYDRGSAVVDEKADRKEDTQFVEEGGDPEDRKGECSFCLLHETSLMLSDSRWQV